VNFTIPIKATWVSDGLSVDVSPWLFWLILGTISWYIIRGCVRFIGDMFRETSYDVDANVKQLAEDVHRVTLALWQIRDAVGENLVADVARIRETSENCQGALDKIESSIEIIGHELSKSRSP